jgi:hypothetical protein
MKASHAIAGSKIRQGARELEELHVGHLHGSDAYGQKWNIQLTVAPVLPKLVRGRLAKLSEMGFGS